jgi:hypothetical protein
MFKNKYLKQLQDVQARIKNCKASIAKLDPPKPGMRKIESNVYYYLEALVRGWYPNIEMIHPQYTDDTYDYLYQLGEYLMNIADYEIKQNQYNQELGQLQIEEGCLKRKLGID